MKPWMEIVGKACVLSWGLDFLLSRPWARAIGCKVLPWLKLCFFLLVGCGWCMSCCRLLWVGRRPFLPPLFCSRCGRLLTFNNKPKVPTLDEVRKFNRSDEDLQS